jgi:putative redox protein
MITVTGRPETSALQASNGRHVLLADAAPEDGGAGAGFKPSDLIEAALAGCVALTLRLYLARHGVETTKLKVTARLDVSDATAPRLDYDFDLGPVDVSPQIAAALPRVAKACPVHKMLTRSLKVERAVPVP